MLESHTKDVSSKMDGPEVLVHCFWGSAQWHINNQDHDQRAHSINLFY